MDKMETAIIGQFRDVAILFSSSSVSFSPFLSV